MSNSAPLPAPTPLAGENQPVDWMFAFKFNAASFPGCTDDGKTPAPGTQGIFGGTVQTYPNGHSQQYVYATSANPTLVQGEGCVGATYTDPLGATFAQIYNNPGYHYVLWNDQFYQEPLPNLDSPWGHSKGMVAWNQDGEGFVLQVSTPSWPGSGSKEDPRETGNTLGAIGDDDDIEVSQHFFALKLSKDDLVAVLKALANASVATDAAAPSIVRNGGPADVQELVGALGVPASERDSKSPQPPPVPGQPTCTISQLSSGVQLISKPSALWLPPWQLVSAELGGLPLRVASWWASPEIYSTDAGVEIDGWPASLRAPGAVAIALTGVWDGTSLGLTGGMGTNYNHAKIGISTDSSQPVCVFGDMNQQGALRANYAYSGQKMSSSQNGRGGTFYVLRNQQLFDSLTALLKGNTAPTSAPSKDSSAAAQPPPAGRKRAAKPKKKPSASKAKPPRKPAAKKTTKKSTRKATKKTSKSTKKRTSKAATSPARAGKKRAAKAAKGTKSRAAKKAEPKGRAAAKKAAKRTTKAAKRGMKKAVKRRTTKARR